MVATAPRGLILKEQAHIDFGKWGFVLLLLLPYAFVFSCLRELPTLDFPEFWWSLRFTFVQAFLSAVVAMVFGLLMGSGLWMLESGRLRQLGRVLCLLPSFLPSLFLILLFFEAVPNPHLGMFAIVTLQGFIYSGFIAALWLSWLDEQGSRLLETAVVLGAGPYQVLALTLRAHANVAFRWGFLVLTICFSAFTIPIALGGGHGTTIEVLIYEKIRGVADRPQALSLSLLQTILLLSLSLGLRPIRRSVTAVSSEFRRTFPNFLMALPIIYIGILVWSLGRLGRAAWGQVIEFSWPSFAIHSLFLGLLTGGIFLLWSLWFAAIWSPQLSRILRGYSAPSLTLMGLALLLWRPASFEAQMIAYAAVMVLLIGPALLRSGPEPLRESLSGQCEVAAMMGASRWSILWKILWPQMRRNLTVTAGLACLWMIGDFALAKVFLSQDWTLAQMVYGLVNAYRLNEAALLLFVLLLLGGFGFLIFWGIGYVRGVESTQDNR